MAGATAVQLSRNTVVRRALELADAEGIEAVTIRRLGQDFGVTPMALYWHVSNKDELLAAMGDELFAGIDLALDASQPWSDRLDVLLVRIVDALRAHPGSVSLAFPRVLMCDEGRDLAEAVLALLREAGFSVRDSADLATQAMRTAVTLVSALPGAAPGQSDDEHEALLAMKRTGLTTLPADRYPALIEAADVLLDCDDEQAYYSSGIALFVAGAQALAAR